MPSLPSTIHFLSVVVKVGFTTPRPQVPMSKRDNTPFQGVVPLYVSKTTPIRGLLLRVNVSFKKCYPDEKYSYISTNGKKNSFGFCLGPGA